jgi:hypothetical protein
VSERRAQRVVPLLALIALATGTALGAQRPVVVQLFTSLGCSDCPPADALLDRVSGRDHDVLALDLHVTYWNNASWADPYALSGVDRLQNAYAALQQESEVYTPEAVVDGRQSFIGSDARAMAAAIARAKAWIATAPLIPASIRSDTRQLTITIGPGPGPGDSAATVWLFGFEPLRRTSVEGGENAGAVIGEVNVVSSITRLGTWRGRTLRLHVPPPAGARFAVILQKADGTILAAAST